MKWFLIIIALTANPPEKREIPMVDFEQCVAKLRIVYTHPYVKKNPGKWRIYCKKKVDN